jgi:hypothetical protein
MAWWHLQDAHTSNSCGARKQSRSRNAEQALADWCVRSGPPATDLQPVGSLQGGIAVKSQLQGVRRRPAAQNLKCFLLPHAHAEQDVSFRGRGTHCGIRQQLALRAHLH